MSKEFIKRPKNRDFIVVPSIIFEDARLSIGAKGLYAQLYYSTNISSLEEITDYTTSSKEELDAWFDELTSVGYILIKDKQAEFVIKPQGAKTVAKKLDQDAVDNFKDAVKEEPKPLSAYDKMVGLVNSYGFDPKVENMLITYFEKWLNKRGRFAEADPLHGYVVRARIGDLVSFHLSDEDMITCIQNSIDKEWFKFVNPNDGNNNSKPNTDRSSSGQFDKTTLVSGSYTAEDIAKIKEQAAKLNENGQKGTY